jgi:hypothetical protein
VSGSAQIVVAIDCPPEEAQNAVELSCPSCAATFVAQNGWLEAVGSWASGNDAARYACGACASAQGLREWTGPWPWAFGHLGLEFWNWPPLKRAFVDQMHALVPGRVRLVHQHI